MKWRQIGSGGSGNSELCPQRAIAAALVVNERYVSNHISAAFLAPKIVEQIADGQEVPNLALPRLLSVVSLSWKEQYATLGNAIRELTYITKQD